MRLFIVAIIATIAVASPAIAREQIRIVGSSTVFPFVAKIAEEFGKNSKFKTPVVESTGTGGGMKLFCSGIGAKHPDITNASRSIKESEIAICKENNITDIIEMKIGFDGIVLANANESPDFDLSIKELFTALAKQVVIEGKLVDNPYKNWDEINPKLPKSKIFVYGPPPTSGTRDAFVEIVMEKGCKMFDEFKAAYQDKKIYKKKCHQMREDGAFVEAGENDNLIIQKLVSSPESMGIFGYGFLDQNLSKVKAAKIDGVKAEFENIADGSYPIARSLYVYAKREHADKISGLREFIKEIASENALSEDGYLVDKGLIPLNEAAQKELREKVSGI